jgi:hypothetical protein
MFGLERVQAANIQDASNNIAKIVVFIDLSFVVAACKSTRFW